MSELFSSGGTDPLYLAVKDKQHFKDIREECERLWSRYRFLAEANHLDEFSKHFSERFWEMYLGVNLAIRYPQIERYVPQAKSEPAPDFKVGNVVIEATVAERGNTDEAIPDISKRDFEDDDDSVPFQQCQLRLTSKVRSKSQANDLPNIGRSNPIIIAVNLPYPEVWIGHNPPITATSFLGMGNLLIAKQTDGTWESYTTIHKTIERVGHTKKNSPVSAIQFGDKSYEHISAVLAASVNPFSSSYTNPSIELLHNPNALHSLPKGWLKMGKEYWLEKETLVCREWTFDSQSGGFE